MKKIILILLITISLNCFGQITSSSGLLLTIDAKNITMARMSNINDINKEVWTFSKTDTVFGWLRIATVDGFKYGKGRVVQDVYEKYDIVPCGGNYAAICYGIITDTRIKIIVFVGDKKIIDKNKWYEFISNDKLQQ